MLAGGGQVDTAKGWDSASPLPTWKECPRTQVLSVWEELAVSHILLQAQESLSKSPVGSLAPECDMPEFTVTRCPHANWEKFLTASTASLGFKRQLANLAGGGTKAQSGYWHSGEGVGFLRTKS